MDGGVKRKSKDDSSGCSSSSTSSSSSVPSPKTDQKKTQRTIKEAEDVRDEVRTLSSC